MKNYHIFLYVKLRNSSEERKVSYVINIIFLTIYLLPQFFSTEQVYVIARYRRTEIKSYESVNRYFR